ncbi:MAG: hypothetical protein MJA31_20845 [Clostridia bacterium]|nr:hypothetical protein [Clostridia bacterium]
MSKERERIILFGEQLTLVGEFIALSASIRGEFSLQIIGGIIIVQGQAILVDAVKKESKDLAFISVAAQAVGFLLVALGELISKDEDVDF